MSQDGALAIAQAPKQGARVHLKRLTASQARPYPPDGEHQKWWGRLKAALGTTSSDFVNSSLYQLIGAARLANGGICEIAVNAALAFVEGAKPENEMQAALAVQMACTHSANMVVLGMLQNGITVRRVVAVASASARLSQAFVSQMETYKRLRNGSSQLVRVEHVHINEGAQAVIGTIGPNNMK